MNQKVQKIQKLLKVMDDVIQSKYQILEIQQCNFTLPILCKNKSKDLLGKMTVLKSNKR